MDAMTHPVGQWRFKISEYKFLEEAGINKILTKIFLALLLSLSALCCDVVLRNDLVSSR